MTAPGARNPGRSAAMAGTARAHAAALGTASTKFMPGVEPVAFVAAEEERRSFAIGPPTEPPNWFCFSGDFGRFGDHAAVGVAQRVEVVRRVERVVAEVLEHASRGTALPPDLVMTLTWPPVPVPNSAG